MLASVSRPKKSWVALPVSASPPALRRQEDVQPLLPPHHPGAAHLLLLLHGLEQGSIAWQDGHEAAAAGEAPDDGPLLRRSVTPVHDRVGLDGAPSRCLHHDLGMRQRVDPCLERRSARTLPAAWRRGATVDAECVLGQVPAVGVHQAERVARRAQPLDEGNDGVRRVVVARAAEPGQAARHRERARVVERDAEHGRGETRREREAAVEVQMRHPLDREPHRLQECGPGAPHAGQAVVVDAVEEVPVLDHVDAGPGIDPAVLGDPEAAGGVVGSEHDGSPLVDVEDRVHELRVRKADHAVLGRHGAELPGALAVAEPGVRIARGERGRAGGEVGELAPMGGEAEAARGAKRVLEQGVGRDRLRRPVTDLELARAGPSVAPARRVLGTRRGPGDAPSGAPEGAGRVPRLGARDQRHRDAAGGDLVREVVDERLRRVAPERRVEAPRARAAEPLGEEARGIAVVVADDGRDGHRVDGGEEPRAAARVLGGALRRLLHQEERLSARGRILGAVDRLSTADQDGQDAPALGWHGHFSRATRSALPWARERCQGEMSARTLRTPICHLFGIEVPIILAGMGGVSMAALVAAVSNAGGLGVMGAANLSPDELRAEIRKTKALTRKPFAVDLLAPLPQMIVPYLPILYEEEVKIFVAGLAIPEKHVAEMHAHGITIMVMTGKVKHAVRAEAAGADVVAAQGTEAGGHTGEIGTLALVPQVVDAVKIPVVAAGGIVDGRGVVAAPALGAQGAIIGTRLISTPEATAAQSYREALVGAEQDETVRTRCYTGKPLRALKNPYIAEHEAGPRKIKPFPDQIMVSVQRGVMRYHAADADPAATCFPAGQGVGGFRDIKPAGEVVREVVAQAEAVLAGGVFSVS